MFKLELKFHNYAIKALDRGDKQRLILTFPANEEHVNYTASLWDYVRKDVQIKMSCKRDQSSTVEIDGIWLFSIFKPSAKKDSMTIEMILEKEFNESTREVMALASAMVRRDVVFEMAVYDHGQESLDFEEEEE